MHALFLALLGCDQKTIYEAPPQDTAEEPVEDTASPLPAPDLEGYAPARSAVWNSFATDGVRMYAPRGDAPTVQVSADAGRSWTATGAVTGFVVGGGGVVYALDDAGIARVESPSSVVRLPLPDGLSRADVWTVTVDGDGVLSFATLAGGLWRHDGAWAPVDTGGAASVRLCGGGGTFAVVRDDAELLRWDGARLVAAGAVTEVSECFVTREGTGLVLEGYGPFVEARFPVGGEPVRTPIEAYVTYGHQGDAVLRAQGGRVEVSRDEGATYTERVAAPVGMTVYAVAPVGEDLVAMGLGGGYEQAFLRLTPDAGAWSVTSAMGAPPYMRVVDLAFAEDGRMALLQEESPYRRVYVQDAFGAWHVGPLLTQGEARAIAIHPDGHQVFVGGAYGSYVLLGDDAATEVVRGTMTSEFGEVETVPVTSAAWVRGLTTTLVVVGTAEESDTDGRLWWWPSPGVDGGNWKVVTPRSSDRSLTLRPGGYHAVSAVGDPGGGPRVLLSMRSWYTTNGWLHDVLSTADANSDVSLWREVDPTWSDVPLATAIAPGTGAQFMLWADGRMGVRAHDMASFRQVQGLSRGTTTARFDPDGRLWLPADGVLQHTREPLGASW